ncbi:septal ring lytic transglycosylase RlpA family protein [Telmatobacter sp. DSM 110680]|uniref:Probable endolytic peptidoglycan transglycosylase RlpA n=1 Tax=Telmatobacter sp. DSM 110680 TaxID=3036704 RepID=A0AAU7DR15_9BACT
MNPKKPLPFWLLVGTSCVALAGVLGTISTRTVQADARLQRPMAAPQPVAATATPALSATPQPALKTHGKIYRGIASWYGSVFNGRKTASGETFDMNAMTACHPTLPFGSVVRVVNLRNRKSVIVRITDRGDLGSGNGRIIDLSYGAAEKLHMTQSGLARVSIEVLALGHSGTSD